MLMEVENKQISLLYTIHNVTKKNGDDESSQKIQDFVKKVRSKKLQIAFCGHFSAGKSSFINEVFGGDVLPTSPIPTSANVVFVEKGKENINLILHDGTTVDVPREVPIEEVKKLCTTGEYVKYIRYYSHKDTFFDDLVLIDTPGVDSVDAAHALSTQSALHLADVIFYMMDYNHVGSQSNLDFMKELSERKKKLYIIINQIDKHIESELPFTQYCDGVKAILESGGIEFEKIYYTSLKKKELRDNDLSSVKQLIQTLLLHKQELIIDTLHKELTHLIGEHSQFQFQQNNDQYNITEADKEIEQHLTQLYDMKMSLHEEVKGKKKQIETEIEKIAQNAYIITPDIRDYAQSFLEGMDPNFKVGFLFSKEKTEKEKIKRLEALCARLKETVETQLVNHLQISKENQEKQYGIMVGSNIGVEEQLLKQIVDNVIKKEAILSPTYVMKYCDDLAYELKRVYKHKVLEEIDTIFKKREEEVSRLLFSIEGEISEGEKRKNHFEAWKEGKEKIEAEKEYLLQIVTDKHKIPNVKEGFTFIEEKTIPYEKWRLLPVDDIYEQAEGHEQQIPTFVVHEEKDLLEKVEEALPFFQSVPQLHVYVDALKEKVKRLHHKTYTLALFGAFSAGKSSFANALIGEKLLPSSPNPTTATVIKIRSATDVEKHGTVKIVFKAENELVEEWSSLCGTVIQRTDDILHINSSSIENESDYKYLKRIQHHFQERKESIGATINRTISNYEAFVKDENIACFVKEAIIYYDCELTLKNIMLVDTPGADSVYSRHTNVSFQYMKHSDGILFVTYYNHAFSKSDRELLIQLGKVKDLSKIDSTFFIINAIDLSNSMEETNTVKAYVEQQLIGYGIKKPRLLPLSSKVGLEYKQGTRSDDNHFQKMEQRIHYFVEHELHDLSIQEMTYTIENMKGVLDETIRIIGSSDREREHQLQKWEEKKVHFEAIVKDYFGDRDSEWLKREVYELMYYVEKRIWDRYYSFYNEAFNPGVFTKQKEKGEVLKECLIDFSQTMSDALRKDVEVTSYRIEKYILKELNEQFNRMNGKELFQQGSLRLVEEANGSFDDYTGTSPSLLEQKKKVCLNILKNVKDAKWFFEKNGKKEIAEQLKAVLREDVNVYIENERINMFEQYERNSREMIERCQLNYIEQIRTYVEYIKEITLKPMDKDDIVRCQEIVVNLLKK